MAKSSAAPANEFALPWVANYEAIIYSTPTAPSALPSTAQIWQSPDQSSVTHRIAVIDAGHKDSGLHAPEIADFIVRACNAHQALYEALSAAVSSGAFEYHNDEPSSHCAVCKAYWQARAALALADAAQG